MNRRNWLKTIAALAAGVVMAPWAAREPDYPTLRGGCKTGKRWAAAVRSSSENELKCFESQGGPVCGLDLDLIWMPDEA